MAFTLKTSSIIFEAQKILKCCLLAAGLARISNGFRPLSEFDDVGPGDDGVLAWTAASQEV